MYICPVCGYDKLDEIPYYAEGAGSYEICPCCGYEFGYDDQYATHDEYRKEWFRKGAVWWAKNRREEIDLREQLKRINVDLPADLGEALAEESLLHDQHKQQDDLEKPSEYDGQENIPVIRKKYTQRKPNS